jgi:hypothetical protein
MSLARLNVASMIATVALLAATAVGCKADEEHTQFDATMKSDGYALFSVDNNRQQRNDVTIKIKDAEPNATYALIFSNDAPTSSGWFALDVNAKSRCGGDLGPHCDLGSGQGYLVDWIKVPEGATEITLRDDRCGCDARNDSKAWTGHWAVLRVERTNTEDQLQVDVWAKPIETIATEPEVSQLL